MSPCCGSSLGVWGHSWFAQFRLESVHLDPNILGSLTQEAFPHQPFHPNIHKCFGNSVLVAGTLSPERNTPPNQAHP